MKMQNYFILATNVKQITFQSINISSFQNKFFIHPTKKCICDISFFCFYALLALYVFMCYQLRRFYISNQVLTLDDHLYIGNLRKHGAESMSNGNEMTKKMFTQFFRKGINCINILQAGFGYKGVLNNLYTFSNNT